jgi:hypothetical protein
MVRLRVIACEVFFREISLVASRSGRTVDLEWLPRGLHDLGGAAMRERLQLAIDEADAARYEAVALGYGLCNNGLVGLAARSVPLVLPRAHDCITAFLGSRERYARYFASHPGTYFRTTGWLERGDTEGGAFGLPTQVGGLGLDRDAMIAKYGEDNARYLMEELGNLTRHYRRLAFIRMGLEVDDAFETRARSEADMRGWEYERLTGDISLLERLVNGPWDDREFLVVPPGRRAVATHDERILALDEAQP